MEINAFCWYPHIFEYKFYDRLYGCIAWLLNATTSALSLCPATIDRLDRIPKRIEPSIQNAKAGR
jgi:hypothetical protein